MNKSKYENEKVIFGYGKATTDLTNDNRNPLLFYTKELRKLKVRKNRLNILDIGCGAGNKTKFLKKQFPDWQFWGCDISRKAIKMARKNPGPVKFIVANAENLPFAAGRFDAVIMHSVLDHTKHPKQTATEAWRVLKAGGTLLLMDPVEAEPKTIHGQLTRFRSFRRHRRERLGHNYAFSVKSLRGLLIKCGFEINNIDFDWFYFAQLIDIIYYPLMSLTGRGPEFTLNKYIEEKSGLWKIVSFFRKLITVTINIESMLTSRIPLGFFAYVVAKKRGQDK